MTGLIPLTVEMLMPLREFGLCQCGCGNKTDIAKGTRSEKGWTKGQPKRYIWGHNPAVSEEDKEFRFWNQMKLVPSRLLPTFCWQWTGSIKTNGYGQYELRGETQAHRISYKLFHGWIPKGLDLDHLCRNRRCINPDHLEPVTRKINARRGAMTKLTQDRVDQIRASALSERKIAVLFGVSRSTVNSILSGRTWV